MFTCHSNSISLYFLFRKSMPIKKNMWFLVQKQTRPSPCVFVSTSKSAIIFGPDKIAAISAICHKTWRLAVIFVFCVAFLFWGRNTKGKIMLPKNRSFRSITSGLAGVYLVYLPFLSGIFTFFSKSELGSRILIEKLKTVKLILSGKLT